MFKDEMWHRNWSRAVSEHKDDLSDKQWQKNKIDLMLKIGKRVKDFSDGCATCRGYQHPLTRLEEEMHELPDSRAQRQYQAQMLGNIADHMVKEHRIAPARYYSVKMLRYGAIAGLIIGLGVVFLVTGNLFHLPIAILLGLALAAIYGYAEDSKVAQEHRLI
ncbi:MAG: hypothetical protein P1S60_03610 [Anaerolineae bacterium]|nr:hypothetical protein [Anaerolineae bacterium]